MIKILKSSFVVISEILILILGGVWYCSTEEIEPLIVIISSSTFLVISILSHFSEKAESKKLNTIGHKNRKILDKDFLYNYVPGDVSINKIKEDFGQPLIRVEDLIMREWSSDPFRYHVYKYKFSNAIVLFTTDIDDDSIISISLVSNLDKKYPIICRHSSEEDDHIFGKAKITKIMIDNIQNFNAETYINWMYSSITARYFYPNIKYLSFTYFIYNRYKDAQQMEGEKINEICISTLEDVKPIIHFYDEF